MFDNYKKRLERDKEKYTEGFNAREEFYKKEVEQLQRNHEIEIKQLELRLEAKYDKRLDVIENAHSETVKTLQKTIDDNEKTHRANMRMLKDQYGIKEKILNRNIEKFKETEEIVGETYAELQSFLREAKETVARKMADIADITKTLATIQKSLEDFQNIESRAKEVMKKENEKIVKITRTITN